MPFPNYHSARILKPDFEKYAYKKLGTGVDLVLGIKDGKSHTQAIRFNVNNFTPEEAKAWLKKHDKKYISFHTAKVVKEEGEAISTATTTTADISPFYKRVGPIVSRQGDRKKKTIREMLEYIINDETDIN